MTKGWTVNWWLTPATVYWCKNQEVRRIPVCKDQRWNLLLNVCVCDLPALAHKKPEQDGRSRTYGASQTLSVSSRHDCVINCCLRLNHVQMKANSQFTATDFRSSKTEIKLVETMFLWSDDSDVKGEEVIQAKCSNSVSVKVWRSSDRHDMEDLQIHSFGGFSGTLVLSFPRNSMDFLQDNGRQT